MKFSRLAVLTLVLLPVTLGAQTSAVGTWRAEFVGPTVGVQQLIEAVTFNIQAAPSGFTGTARAADWLGDLTLSAVKLEGGRLTFTATSKVGWTTITYRPPAPPVDHCCVSMTFAGTIQGDAMNLTMTWHGSNRPDDANAPQALMEAKRLSR